MNLKTRSGNRTTFGLRSLIVGICTAAAFAFAPQAAAQLTNIGAGAFSGSATTLTFEDLPGEGAALPAGYGSGSGVSFSAGTTSELYADYSFALATAATTAGLGNVAATWGGGIGTFGTGFSLTSAQTRVGFYLSSNEDISVQVDAYRSSVLLGSQTLILSADQIGFAGFQHPNGIDQIVIGNNTLCERCVHQLDNVMFESQVAPVASTPIPTMSQWGMIMLASLLALGAFFNLRRRRQ